MMKKILAPTILFLAVLIACLSFQYYSLACKEFFGLFLFTPDFFRETFAGSWPLSNLIGGFLTQFFYYPVLGAVITALISTCVMLMVNDALRACGTSIPGAAAGCAAWILMAFSDSITAGVTIFLISIVLCLSSHLFTFKKRTEKRWSVAASLVLVSGNLCFIALNRDIHKTEDWSKIEYASINHDWQKVLGTATPYKCVDDRNMIPFALLALNGCEQLSQRISEYPINHTVDLDMSGDNSREAMIFNSILYEMLDVPNESLHYTFQAGCTLPHGTSNGLLRQLVKFNIMTGNSALVAKYGTILTKNPVNSRIGRKVVDIAAGTAGRQPDSIPSYKAGTVTIDPYFNLILIGTAGNESPFLYDRIRAYQIIDPAINNHYLRYE